MPNNNLISDELNKLGEHIKNLQNESPFTRRSFGAGEHQSWAEILEDFAEGQTIQLKTAQDLAEFLEANYEPPVKKKIGRGVIIISGARTTGKTDYLNFLASNMGVVPFKLPYNAREDLDKAMEQMGNMMAVNRAKINLGISELAKKIQPIILKSAKESTNPYAREDKSRKHRNNPRRKR